MITASIIMRANEVIVIIRRGINTRNGLHKTDSDIHHGLR